MTLKNRVQVARRLRDERHAQRAARLRLERELAQYTTASDRQEIDAILGRHSAAEASTVEAVLTSQAVERAHSRVAAY